MAHLIIVGASTRAAAQCARRAGHTVWCADYFADADLRRIATARVVAPAKLNAKDLTRILRDEAPPGPWLYTGGMENRIEVVEALSGGRELWGCQPSALRLARDPLAWTNTLRAEGLPTAAVEVRPPPQRDDKRHLVKPRFGAGGRGIQAWDGQSLPPETSPDEWYWQEHIVGEAAAALYLAPWTEDGSAEFLGLYSQLTGLAAAGAPGPFAYVGSIGPIPCNMGMRRQLVRQGDVLARWAGLRGVFGVDGIVRVDEFVPVEINPRFTASAELVERWLGQPCLFGSEPAVHMPHQDGVVGKIILFARKPVEVRTDLLQIWPESLGQSPHPWGGWADLPTLGSRIEPGQPILTVFAEADDVAACRDLLVARAERIYRFLEEGPSAAE